MQVQCLYNIIEPSSEQRYLSPFSAPEGERKIDSDGKAFKVCIHSKV